MQHVRRDLAAWRCDCCWRAPGFLRLGDAPARPRTPLAHMRSVDRAPRGGAAGHVWERDHAGSLWRAVRQRNGGAPADRWGQEPRWWSSYQLADVGWVGTQGGRGLLYTAQIAQRVLLHPRARCSPVFWHCYSGKAVLVLFGCVCVFTFGRLRRQRGVSTQAVLHGARGLVQGLLCAGWCRKKRMTQGHQKR